MIKALSIPNVRKYAKSWPTAIAVTERFLTSNSDSLASNVFSILTEQDNRIRCAGLVHEIVEFCVFRSFRYSHPETAERTKKSRSEDLDPVLDILDEAHFKDSVCRNS